MYIKDVDSLIAELIKVKSIFGNIQIAHYTNQCNDLALQVIPCAKRDVLAFYDKDDKKVEACFQEKVNK